MPTSGPVPGVPGKLLYSDGSAFQTLEPSTKAIQQLVAFPSGNPDAPAVSPDGTRIAFSLYLPDPDATQASSVVDLHVMEANGTNQRVVLAHKEPGEWLTEPAWAADGQSLYFTRRSPKDAPRIETVRLDGSGRAVVVENAQSPTVSPDGGSLAYLADSPEDGSLVLMVASSDGTNARQLLDGGDFQSLAAPRFSTDGKQIAFVAVGGPGTSPSGRSEQSPAAWLPAWLVPRVAEAHGVPWDVWVVNADGSGLQRLTDLGEDSPVPAWSPDGKWIALTGELGIYLLDTQDKQLRRLVAEVAGQGLAWLER